MALWINTTRIPFLWNPFLGNMFRKFVLKNSSPTLLPAFPFTTYTYTFTRTRSVLSFFVVCRVAKCSAKVAQSRQKIVVSELISWLETVSVVFLMTDITSCELMCVFIFFSRARSVPSSLNSFSDGARVAHLWTTCRR